MSISLDALKSDHVEDARNTPCPGPLIKLKLSIESVLIGQVLELWATDEGAKEDIPAWAKKSGNEYLGSVPRDGYSSYFILRKK